MTMDRARMPTPSTEQQGGGLVKKSSHRRRRRVVEEGGEVKSGEAEGNIPDRDADIWEEVATPTEGANTYGDVIVDPRREDEMNKQFAAEQLLLEREKLRLQRELRHLLEDQSENTSDREFAEWERLQEEAKCTEVSKKILAWDCGPLQPRYTL
eukprot:PhF_6_TR17011/c0_g1_i1/m.25775